jgi:hypothetical protein
MYVSCVIGCVVPLRLTSGGIDLIRDPAQAVVLKTPGNSLVGRGLLRRGRCRKGGNTQNMRRFHILLHQERVIIHRQLMVRWSRQAE